MPDLRAWITPDSIPEGTICRPLMIPDEPLFIAAVNGVLSLLQLPQNWQQYAGVTPEEAAAAAATMLGLFWGEACGMAALEISVYYHQVGQNVAGGGYTGPNIDNRVPFNLAVISQPWLSLTNNVFTIQPGRYLLEMAHVLNLSSGQMWPFVRQETGFPVYEIHGIQRVPASDKQLYFKAILNTESEFQFGFWMRSNNNSVATNGFGVPKNLTPYNEIYGHVLVTRLGDF